MNCRIGFLRARLKHTCRTPRGQAVVESAYLAGSAVSPRAAVALGGRRWPRQTGADRHRRSYVPARSVSSGMLMPIRNANRNRYNHGRVMAVRSGVDVPSRASCRDSGSRLRRKAAQRNRARGPAEDLPAGSSRGRRTVRAARELALVRYAIAEPPAGNPAAQRLKRYCHEGAGRGRGQTGPLRWEDAASRCANAPQRRREKPQ